jgi:hypothetical protein
VASGKPPEDPAVRSRKPEVERVPFEDESSAAVRSLRGHLELEEIEAALGVYRQTRRTISGWRPPPREWLELIQELIKNQSWSDAVELMTSYVEEAEGPSARVRLKLGQVLVQKQERPGRALKVLAGIPDESLPGPLETLRRQLINQAELLLSEGVLELDDEV